MAKVLAHNNYYYDDEKRYRGRRPANGQWVYGFLIHDVKSDAIVGILNEANRYAELAWIVDGTEEEIPADMPRVYDKDLEIER